MQYLLLIYDEEKKFEDMSAADQEKFSAAYFAYTESIKKSGHFRAGDALRSVSTATTVRVRDGKTLTTDGPFAETREQLGGYYLVEAANLDDAVALAARIPSAHHGGSIEVRPIMVYG
ncbi:MAG TPA: YciI family protein [Kofleriaceae bacterium]|nr:YciI family protein [Kofleriaceae bacterium]